jgi:hypothetical protein
MVQLKLIPRADRAGGNRHIGEKTISHSSTTASRAAPVWSVASSAEARKNALRSGQAPAAAPIGRQSVAPVLPATIPGFTLTSGLRLLIAALVLVALVPNLVLGAMFWFGTINPPQLKPVTPTPAIQTVLPAVLTAPATIEATAGEEVGFPIALDGTDGVPPRSVIAIGGLPQDSSFSDGRPYGETEWNLRTDQIGDLRLILPDTANDESKLTIKLIAPDGSVIADAETILMVAQAAPEQAAPDGSEAIQANVGVEEGLTPVAAAIAPSGDAAIVPSGESAKPPSDKPDQTENEEAGANWVQPSEYVNLRDGPSSSSRIVGVVAKGAKVEIVERKRGWLQVTNPATSEKGWIYSGYIEGAAMPHSRTKRAARAEPEQKSESFWSSVGRWLSPSSE